MRGYGDGWTSKDCDAPQSLVPCSGMVAWYVQRTVPGEGQYRLVSVPLLAITTATVTEHRYDCEPDGEPKFPANSTQTWTEVVGVELRDGRLEVSQDDFDGEDWFLLGYGREGDPPPEDWYRRTPPHIRDRLETR